MRTINISEAEYVRGRRDRKLLLELVDLQKPINQRLKNIKMKKQLSPIETMKMLSVKNLIRGSKKYTLKQK